MTASRNGPLLAVDLLGGSALALCVLAFGWLTMFRGDDVSANNADLTRAIQTAKQDLAGDRGVLDRQRVILADRRAELASGGRLPDHAPIERYFQTLSSLAAQHRLRVRSHHPVSPRHYSGLLELRYAYELSGSMPDITRFFRSVEGTEFWADISFLKLEQGPGLPREGSSRRIASLTISLFSALPVKPEEDEG